MVSDNGSGSKLVAALIAAKKKFKPLVKNKVNPHFRSEYADLAAVHEAVDDALGENGLTICQPIEINATGNFFLKTELLHVSGEAKVSVYPLPGGGKPQDVGSAITYGMRYSICSLLGIAPQDQDDDGNAAQAATNQPAPERKAAKKPSDPVKAEPPKAEANLWVGALVAVEAAGNGKWKIKGGDAAASEFGTVVPEHAAVAKDAIAKKTRVAIKFVTQTSNGIKRITSIDPMIEEAQNG